MLLDGPDVLRIRRGSEHEIDGLLKDDVLHIPLDGGTGWSFEITSATTGDVIFTALETNLLDVGVGLKRTLVKFNFDLGRIVMRWRVTDPDGNVRELEGIAEIVDEQLSTGGTWVDSPEEAIELTQVPGIEQKHIDAAGRWVELKSGYRYIELRSLWRLPDGRPNLLGRRDLYYLRLATAFRAAALTGNDADAASGGVLSALLQARQKGIVLTSQSQPNFSFSAAAPTMTDMFYSEHNELTQQAAGWLSYLDRLQPRARTVYSPGAAGRGPQPITGIHRNSYDARRIR